MNTSKIIKAYIGAGTYSTTEPITQWDYGYILQIEGAELPAIYRVDFSNDRHEGEALTVYGNENGAEVPEELIATGKDIFAFYYYIGENFGKTAYTWKIPNDTRAKYGDRTPTPTQQDSIDQLIVRSNEAVETAEQKASEADQSAQSAKEDADRAERARDDASTFAQRSANSAQASADYSESAQASATASANSASQSAQIKADVEDLADDAQGYAQASAQSASQASASEQGCARAVLDAASAAAIARARAEEASGYAQTASAKAQDASQSASTASQKATESAQSASQALTYKTDAESAKTASQTAQGLAESARDSAITAKNDAESAKADAESARDEAQSIVETYDGRLTKIDGLVFPQFELGNIQISSSGWTYADSPRRIRTPQGYTVHLKEGSKISIAEGARFYVGALKSDDTYYDGGTWQTSELILPVEGDYVILVTYLPQVTVTDIDALASMLTVYSIDNALEDIENINTRLTNAENALVDKADVITDTASGSIASFSDGADNLPLKSLVVDINPIQDLHGQDVPYPAGGGKNLIIPPEYTAATPTLCLDLGADTEFSAITLQFKATDAVALYNNAAIIDFRKDDETHQYVTLAEFYNENGVRFTPNTVLNGTFSSTKTNVTFRKVYIYYEYSSFAKFQSDCLTEWQLAVGSTATSYAPYENLCPISGWTGMEISATGKNLLDETKLNDAHLINCFLDDASHPQQRKGIAIYLPSGTYSFTGWKTLANAYLYYNIVKKDGTFVSFGFLATGRDYSSVRITLLDDEHILFFDQQAPQEATQTKFGNYNLQIELGSTATDYEPYTGRTITIDLGQTVYGAHIDVLSGGLVVDRAMVDMGTLNWTKFNVTQGALFRSGTIANCNSAYNSTNFICSNYATVKSSSRSNGTISSGTRSAVDIIDNNYSDKETFKSAMSGVQLVYELEEPIEIQLDAHTLNSLLGQNNIFADTGDSEVEYRADTKLYIERLTAPDSDDMIADANIVSGQYFMVGNTLFKATANIANGASIIVGTNCTRKSLSEALNEINA